MRCPDCAKFVGMETLDPEVESLEVEDRNDGTATVTATVRCVRACADCGTELKETTFEVECEVAAVHVPFAEGDASAAEHELEVEEESVESTESGGGRYAKNLIGFALDFKVTCSCGLELTGQLADSLQASAWDEI
jgi:hypothetical protein